MFKINSLARKALKLSAFLCVSNSISVEAQTNYGAGSLVPTTLIVAQGPNSDATANITLSSGTGITGSCWNSATTTTATFGASVPGVTITSASWSVAGGISLTSQSLTSTTVKPVYDQYNYRPGLLTYSWRGTKDSVVSVTTTYTYDACVCGAGGTTVCTPTTGTKTENKTFVLQKSGTASINLEQKFTHNYPIIGPACVSPGDSVTFSIRSLVSDYAPKDGYYWTYSAGVNLTGGTSSNTYQSIDLSSVTNKITNITFPASLTVKVGSCNQTTDTNKRIIFKQKMAKPVTAIAGYTNKKNTCVPLNVSQVALTVTGADNTNINYLWSTDIAGYSVASGSLASSAVTLNIGAGVGKIYLTASPKGTAFCTINNQPLYDTIVITRSTKGAAILTNPVCLGQGQSQTLTLSPNPGVPVMWSAPTGWTLGADANGSVLITATSSAVSGQTVIAKTAACQTAATDTAKRVVRTKAGDLTGTLGGLTCINSGDITAKTYTIPTAATLATGYRWTLPTGWTAQSPAVLVSAGVYTTTALSISAVPNGTSVGTLSVVPLGNCANGAGLNTTINFGAIAATNITFVGTKTSINANGAGTTTANYPIADNFSLQVPSPIAGQTYTWTMNPTSPNFVVNGTAPVTGTSASFTTNGVAGTYTVQVAATSSACAGSPANFTKTFTIAPNTARLDSSYDDVTGIFRFVVKDNATNAFYPAGTTYAWYKNGVLIAGQTTRVLNVGDGASALTNISVDVTPAGATSATRLTKTSRNANQLRTASLDDETTTASVSVSPSPANSEFVISLTSLEGAEVNIVSQSTGVSVKQFTATTSITKVNTSGWASGVYLVIANANGKRYTSSVVVQH